MDKLIRKAKEAVGRGETPDPKVELARKKTDAQVKLKAFERKESDIQDRVDFTRAKAKKALRDGNTREYKVLKPQVDRLVGQLMVTSKTIDSARAIIGVMDSQNNVSDIVKMGRDLAEMQKELGIDPQEIQDATTQIRMSMDNAESMNETLSSISDTLSNGDDIERGDPLKAELMAEIQSESAVNGFGDTIKDKLKEFE